MTSTSIWMHGGGRRRSPLGTCWSDRISGTRQRGVDSFRPPGVGRETLGEDLRIESSCDSAPFLHSPCGSRRDDPVTRRICNRLAAVVIRRTGFTIRHSAMTAVGSDRRSVLWGMALASIASLLAACVYVNALDNPFVWDDHHTVADNPSIVNALDLATIVRYDVKRPLVNFSFALDRALWGPEPFGFHVTNLALHMLNVLLLFGLTLRVMRLAPPRPASALDAKTAEPLVVAFATAAIFAVHPMMTEAVGYVSGRSEVLCATFFLLSFLSAERWLRGDDLRWLILGLVLWLPALLSREVAIVWPFVLFLYDRLVLGSGERRSRSLWLHVLLISIAAAAGAVRLGVFIWLEHPGEVVIRWRHALVELDVVRQYLSLMVASGGQSIFHGVSSVSVVLNGNTLMAAALVVSVFLLAWRARRFDARITFGVFWFFLLLLPSSFLVMLDLGEPMAEHRVYLASCGLFMAVGLLVGYVVARSEGQPRRHRVVRLALVAGLVALGGTTIVRNDIWSDPVLLWRDARDKAPDLWVPHVMLGESLQAAGRKEEAIASYRMAQALRPEEKFTYMKLGLCLAELERLDEAAEAFGRLQRLDPRSVIAHEGLGTVAMMQGKAHEAERYFRMALQVDPESPSARRSLALLNEAVPRKTDHRPRQETTDPNE